MAKEGELCSNNPGIPGREEKECSGTERSRSRSKTSHMVNVLLQEYSLVPKSRTFNANMTSVSLILLIAWRAVFSPALLCVGL